jgi:hypothetical protein
LETSQCTLGIRQGDNFLNVTEPALRGKIDLPMTFRAHALGFNPKSRQVAIVGQMKDQAPMVSLVFQQNRAHKPNDTDQAAWIPVHSH